VWGTHSRGKRQRTTQQPTPCAGSAPRVMLLQLARIHPAAQQWVCDSSPWGHSSGSLRDCHIAALPYTALSCRTHLL
jgi:hypothetical protein